MPKTLKAVSVIFTRPGQLKRPCQFSFTTTTVWIYERKKTVHLHRNL